MDAKTILGATVLLLATSMAGCTGDFEVRQDEPIRVQMEGEPQRVEVREDDPEPQRIVVENPDRAESVDIEVTVTRISEGPVTVAIIVEDEETGEVFIEREVTVGDGNDTETNTTTEANTTTATETNTMTETQTETSSDDTVVQNFFVDVKGKDNFVVLTQSLEGDADVDIGARTASGNSTVEGNQTF